MDQEMTLPGQGPVMLILSPTRELALQTLSVVERFGSSCKLKCVDIIGGKDRQESISKLRESFDIGVATPGRAIDLLKARMLSLERVTFLVIDEADKMLDMGFMPQITQILSHIRPD